MLFSSDMLQAVLEGRKTQTRRPSDGYESYDRLTTIDGLKTVQTRKWLGWRVWGDGEAFEEFSDWRMKWQVGRTYAITPGRGKRGVARIRLLDIRRELASEITQADAEAEGFDSPAGFFDKIRALYGQDFEMDSPFYALTFELVQS